MLGRGRRGARLLTPSSWRIFVQNITRAGLQHQDCSVFLAVFLSKTSPKLNVNINRAYFFIFVAWISLIFFFGVRYSQLFWNKSWPQGGIHEVQKKSSHRLDIRLRPRAIASTQPDTQVVSNYFIFPSWNHLCFKIYCQIFVKPSKIEKKINETRTQKKLRGLYLKPFRVSSNKKLSNL